MTNQYVINQLADEILLALSQGKDVVLPINGYSMFPTFVPHKTTVTISPILPKKYDIALFVTPSGQFVLHRIVQIDNNSFCALGDGEINIQKNIPLEAIKGVVKTYTNGNKVVDLSKKNYTLINKLWISIRPIRRPILKILKICKK